MTSRVTTLVRSGWWVAAAGLLVALVILILAWQAPKDRGHGLVGDGRNPTTYGFDLSRSLLPPDAVVASGMPRDGLMALVKPEMLTAAGVEALNQEGRGKFLLPTDRVVGLEVDGEARAYPVRFMRWHEVVNDVVGGVPVLVTYSPLCDAAVASVRRIDDNVLEFGHSGLIFNSNTLLYDRGPDAATGSLWSQINQRAVVGPAAANEESLELLPAALCTWGQWRETHPDSLVLAPLEHLRRVYKRDPYHSYFGSDILRFPVEPLPATHDLALKERVLILTVNGDEVVFALSRIASAVGADTGRWGTTVGDLPVTIDFDLERGAALAQLPHAPDRHVASRQAFWFAWYAQNPDTPSPGPRP